MLAAILAILGVVFAGTIGIGAVGSMIQNRDKKTPSTGTPAPKPEKPKREKRKKKDPEPERDQEQERDPEPERDPEFLRRRRGGEPHPDPIDRGGRRGVDPRPAPPVGGGEGVEETPEEVPQEKMTKEGFLEVIDLVRSQMMIDTEEYYRMVDARVKEMDLDPNTEEHREIVSQTMKRDWDRYVAGLNNYLDDCVNKLTDENADELYHTADKFFDTRYSLEKRYAYVTKPNGIVEKASSKYRIYDERMRESGIFGFMDRTQTSMSPQVILPREHVEAMMRKYLGDIVGGSKRVDEFERDLSQDIAGVKNEVSVADSLVSIYDEVFNQGERIADLEKFKVSAEKWIVSTDKTLEEMAEKLDFEALAQMLKDVEVLKAKLEGIGDKETVVGKLKELETNIGKTYGKKFEEIEKALGDSNKKIADIEKEIVALRNSLKGKVNSATMTSKMKALETKVTELETKLTERLDKMAEEIAVLTEQVDGNNKEVTKLLEEKIGEFLESDQGMVMFANNFAKMMKSRNPEVKRIVETAIIDKIKRYLNTKGGREKFDPIIINKINNVIANNPDITTNIVNIVIQKIQEGQVIIGGDGERRDGDVYITVNGDVYGVNMAGVLEDAIKSITINGDVIGKSPEQKGKGSKK